MRQEKRLLSTLACLITILVIIAPMVLLRTAQAAGDKELVVHTWGGRVLESQQHAFFEPFKRETGIKIVPVTAAGELWGKVAAQVKSGNIEWDIVWPDNIGQVGAAAQKGLIQELDFDIITDTKDLVPGAVTKYGVGLEIVDFIYGYNHKVFPGDKHPKSWADFYDPKKFPGLRGTHNWGTPVLHFISALLADGVPPDELVPIDWDRAFKVLDRVKSDLIFYNSGDKAMQLMIDEEAVMCFTTDARTKTSILLGAPVSPQWNQGIAYINYHCVVKGAPHREAAMRFINFTCRPEQQAIWTNYMSATCVNPRSLEYIHPTFMKDQVTYPENWEKRVDLYTEKTVEWFTEHNDEINERFNEWVSK